MAAEGKASTLDRSTRLNSRARAIVPLVAILFVGSLVWLAQQLIEGSDTQTTATAIAATSGSGVVCSDAVWDFGSVDQARADQLEHAFVLSNVSDRPIGIERVTPECGCIVADDLRQIEPGSTAGLHVAVNVLGRPPGSFSKRIFVQFATEPASNFFVFVRGQIKASPELRSVPPVLDFGTITLGERVTRSIRLARYDATPVRFLRATPDLQGISAGNGIASDDADSTFELRVDLDSSLLSTGPFTSSVRVVTDHPTRPDVTFPIKGQIIARASGLVSSVFVDRLGVGASVEKSLADGSGPCQPLESIRFEGEGESDIEVQLLKDEGSDRPKPTVRISRSETGAARVVRGQLVVKLSDIGEIRIPLVVYLSDKEIKR